MSERSMTYLIVFICYGAFMIWGVWKSLKQVESFSDFTTGGHRMGMWMGVGTTVATWVSVASVMGVPGYMYRTGAAAIIGWICGWLFCQALFPLLAFKVRMPELPTRTFPEFLRLRYEPNLDRSPLQIILALFMFVGYFIFVHLQVVGFGIVFNTITGVPYEYAVFGFLIVLSLTCLGGFWSVAASDCVNAVLILIGVFCGAAVVLQATGGVSSILDAVAVTTAPINVGGPPLEPGIMLTAAGSFGAGALFNIFISNAIGTFVAPHWIVRFMAPKNAKAASMQFMWMLVGLTLIFMCLTVLGFGAKVLIPSLPADKTTDYIIPVLLDQYAPPLVAATTLVALMAAAVSSANSFLLNASTSLYYDVYVAMKGRQNMDDAKATKQLRLWVLAIGTLVVISAIKPPMLLAMGFTYVYGSFAAVLFWGVILGLYSKRMNREAMYVTLFVGLIVYLTTRIMGFANPTVMGIVAAFVGMVITLKLTPPPPLESYEAFFTPDVSPSTMETIRRIRHEETVENTH